MLLIVEPLRASAQVSTIRLVASVPVGAPLAISALGAAALRAAIYAEQRRTPYPR
jgi:hypothetical protein